MERLARTARVCRKIPFFRALAPSSSSPHISRGLESTLPTVSGGSRSRALPEALRPYSLFPAALIGIFGIGVLETAYADESAAESGLPSNSPSSSEGLEETAKKERERIGELLKNKGIRYGFYPRFTVGVKGQKVSIKFQIPPACEVAQLIAHFATHLGLKTEEQGGGSDMLLRAWDSTFAWQFTLTRPRMQKDSQGNDQCLKDKDAQDEDLCVLIFHSHLGSDKAEIEFLKKGSLSPEELDAFVSALQLAGEKLGQRNTQERKSREETERAPSVDKSISSLESMGVRIYGLNESQIRKSSSEVIWDSIAGYDYQKREIEDTILLALQCPEVYDDIARGTRYKFESNRPRAVLFEGPPGTGKTSCARVIANQAGVPLLYVPLEIVMSKYYGESERLLGKVFSLANELPNGAIIFLDEIDSFAGARDTEMHEATRRVLSVLLRQIDGFEQDKKVVVIAATNRKQDLDPALISRFDSMISFDLPDHQNRQEIAAKYAKHLTKSELNELAKVTEDMAGRDIRDICLQAERSWASKIIRGQISQDEEQRNLPPLQEYLESAASRRKTLVSSGASQKFRSSYPGKKSELDLV